MDKLSKTYVDNELIATVELNTTGWRAAVQRHIKWETVNCSLLSQ